GWWRSSRIFRFARPRCRVTSNFSSCDRLRLDGAAGFAVACDPAVLVARFRRTEWGAASSNEMIADSSKGEAGRALVVGRWLASAMTIPDWPWGGCHEGCPHWR